MDTSHLETREGAQDSHVLSDHLSAPRPKEIAVPRLWPAVVIVAMYWAVMTWVRTADLAISTTFFSMMGGSLALALLFIIWWLAFSRFPVFPRLIVMIVCLACATVAALASDRSVGVFGVLLAGVPIVTSAWIAWLLVAGRLSRGLAHWGLIGLLVVLWSSLTVVRVEGVDGDNQAALDWRWKPTAEDRYLAERSDENQGPAAADESAAAALELSAGDWPEFRGPNRQGEVHGVRFAADWNDNPPQTLWRQKIGPAWSSVVIIGDRLFTQEQRGQQEVVVALDAATGREIWAHEDQTRWSDGQAGAGPRATPTFFAGRIYTLGATGVLNCLDAATGRVIWKRDIVADSGAPIPMWGFSSSPLVAENLVSVFAGGPGDKGLVAYDAASGQPAWTAATGPVSYSSPQLASFDGSEQLLMLSDTGLVAVDPRSGAPAWDLTAPSMGIWRVVQPRQIGDNGLLLGSEDLGLVRLAVSRAGDKWSAERQFSSRAIRPAYNDFVVADGFLYGFDESILCCVDLETGKRRWKSGRYGHGQVLLVVDAGLLVVVTENGEMVLVAARSAGHEELGRFQAVTGKTWNHPVIAHGKLFVRNDLEIACFELQPVDAPHDPAAANTLPKHR